MSPAWSAVMRSLPSLWKGLLTTLEVSGIVVAAALVAGAALGAALAYGPRWVRWPIRVLADVIRGVPILVLIFFVYYVVPASGLTMSGFTAAVLALSLFSTAQVIEITRGACESIHQGQIEAGKSIGLTFPKVPALGGISAGFAPLPAALAEQRDRCGEGQRAGVAGRDRGSDDVDPAGDRPHLRAAADVCRGRGDVLRHQLQPLQPQPPAGSAHGVYPGLTS